MGLQNDIKIHEKNVGPAKRYGTYFSICQILAHFSTFRAFFVAKYQYFVAQKCDIQNQLEKLSIFIGFLLIFIFSKDLPVAPLRAESKNEFQQNFVLMMRM